MSIVNMRNGTEAYGKEYIKNSCGSFGLCVLGPNYRDATSGHQFRILLQIVPTSSFTLPGNPRLKSIPLREHAAKNQAIAEN